MKRIFILFSLLLFGISLSVFAKKVGIDQARQVGKNFYFERINSREPVSFNQMAVTGEYTVSGDGLPLFYIFNIGETGYIIVTASDQVYPVIGYSFETNWNNEDVPAHVQGWLNGYKGDILDAIARGYSADATIAGAWERYSSPVAVTLPEKPLLDVTPLVTSLWNQDFPNNAMCPADPASGGSYSGHVPVGCVATAMTQIMHYWRYPETGQGSHCIWPVQTQYGQQCADFGATTYDWNGMVNSTPKECDPVAVLSWHAGIAVDMQYSPTGSGAYTTKVPGALETYFKYSTSCLYVQRMSYSYNDWIAMLKGDLDASKPIEYSGSGPDGGHAWVCDGYQGTDYFHMNWGWGGAYNGYFYLSNLNPGGSNFNQSQNAIIHIEPNPAYYPEYCTGQTNIVTNDFGSLEDGSGPIANYQNNANCSWLIAPDDSVETIELSFVRFNLASGDELKIYDGNSASAPLLATYSGSSLPPAVTTTGPSMFLTFTTDGSGSAQGFLAEYDCNLVPFCSTSVTLLDPSGNISDGSNSFLYRNSTVCKWYIKPTNAATVTLDFSSFNTETTNDRVQVYDLVSGNLLGTYSGNLNPPPTDITAGSGQMLVMWSTNKIIRGEGWQASYTITVSTEESDAVDNLRIFPNPTSGKLTVSFENSASRSVTLDLVSLKGAMVYSATTGPFKGMYEKTLDLSALAKGVYTLKITSEKGVSVSKVIVQ